MTSKIVKQIDALLPQTQCGLCGFKGCLPYAEALALGEAAINLCPPGGSEGLLALAKLLGKNPAPYLEDMKKNAKLPTVAIIREAECIGCTKCIQACPVDAIIGTAKEMHSVLIDECTGCELCISPCPVDCIEMQPILQIQGIKNPLTNKREQFKTRYEAREKRLAEKNSQLPNPTLSLNDKKNFIQEVLLRAKKKTNNV